MGGTPVKDAGVVGIGEGKKGTTIICRATSGNVGDSGASGPVSVLAERH